jgi:hypothetical protein
MAPPAAGGVDPAHQHSDYQNMHDQWSQMAPPNPAGLIQLLLTPGFLTKHQLDMIKALLSSPGSAAGTTQAAPAAPPAANPLGGGPGQ